MTPQAQVEARAPGATLSAALAEESALVLELAAIMRRQRAGIAVDDITMVDDSVFAAHRLLRTMGEARRRRAVLTRALVGAADVPITALESALGPALAPDVENAVGDLRAAARQLDRELSLNRRVLEDALRAGEERIQLLGGGPVEHGGDRYGAATTVERPRLLNKRA